MARKTDLLRAFGVASTARLLVVTLSAAIAAAASPERAQRAAN